MRPSPEKNKKNEFVVAMGLMDPWAHEFPREVLGMSKLDGLQWVGDIFSVWLQMGWRDPLGEFMDYGSRYLLLF